MNKNLTLPTIAVASVMMLGSGLADAHHRNHDRNGYQDSQYSYSHRHNRHRKGRVIKVKPIYKMVSVPVTKRRCGPGHRGRHHNRHNDMGGAVAGGLIGGLIGNRVADRGDRAALTVVGALLGGVIGHEVGDNGHRRHRHGPGCKQVTSYSERRELVGYKVKYRYRGEIYKTRTNRHPGKFIRVNRADRLAWR